MEPVAETRVERCLRCGVSFTVRVHPKLQKFLVREGDDGWIVRAADMLCAACCQKRAEQEEQEKLERERREAEEQRRWRIEHAPELLVDHGVLLEHADAKLSDFDLGVQGAVRGLLDDPATRRGLLITGGNGTGKTRLVTAIAREVLIEHGPGDNHRPGIGYAPAPFKVLLARQFFRQIWATYRDGVAETEDHVIRYFTNIGMLLIDDLAYEGRVTEATIGALHEVVSIRNGNFRPTCITTNLTLNQIRENYGGSIASRLGAWTPIVITGPDRRSAA